MGKQDIAVNRLLERREIFADLINGTLYGGAPVVHTENLVLLSPRSGLISEHAVHKTRSLERFGDIRMRADHECYSVIFVGETQSGVDYAMPVRMMLYSALEYTKQIQELEHRHRKSSDRLRGDELLSGIARTDRIAPVVNIVFYLGDHWDGSKTLYDMLDVDWSCKDTAALKQYLPDYPINLISAQDIEHPEKYKTCLQQIFCLLKYRKDKKKLYQYVHEHRQALNQMDYIEQTAAFVLMGESKLLDKMIAQGNSPGKGVDMCKAIDDLILDGELRGEKRGKKLGEELGKKLGEELGEKRGEKRMTDLILTLVSDGKANLIAEMAADASLRKQLLKQYGL